MSRNLIRLLSFSILLIFVQTSVAQTTPSEQVSWGAVFEIPRGFRHIGMAGDPQRGCVQISFDERKTIAIQKLSPALEPVGEKKLTLEIPEDAEDFIVQRLGSGYFCFFSISEKNKDTYYGVEVNVVTGDLAGPPVVLVSAVKPPKRPGTVHFGGLNSRIEERRSEVWQFMPAADCSTIFILHRNNGAEVEEWEVNGFNQSLTKTIHYNITMPDAHTQMYPIDSMADNDGSIYMAVRKFDTPLKPLESAPYKPGKVQVYRWKASEGQPVVIPFDKPVNVHDIKMVRDVQGNILAVGLYKNSRTSDNVDGVFTFRYNESKGIMEQFGEGTFSLSAEFLKHQAFRRTQRKPTTQLKDFIGAFLRLRMVLTNPDSSIQILCERVPVYYAGNSVSFEYADIVAISLTSSGSINWIQRLPKRQNSKIADDTYSFNAFYRDRHCTFLFFDNANNLSLSPGEEAKVHKGGFGGVLMRVTLNEEGDVKKSILFDIREEDLRVRVADFQPFGDHQVINRAYRRQEGKTLLVGL